MRFGLFYEALRSAAEDRQIFGKDSYFLELMDHGIEFVRRVRDGLLEIERLHTRAPRTRGRAAAGRLRPVPGDQVPGRAQVCVVLVSA